VFLLVVEPLLKGLALSVLVVSVPKQQRKTMMPGFVTSYAMANLYQGITGAESGILFYCTAGMTSLLVAMQRVAALVSDCRGGAREDHGPVCAASEDAEHIQAGSV